jgi:hypothetical protein
LSGDFTLTADVKFIGTGGNPHRKACLLVRQSLKPGSVYADVALHGSGLTALQYRDMPDGTTQKFNRTFPPPCGCESKNAAITFQCGLLPRVKS